MSKGLNYFKTYKIENEEILYIDGDSYDLTSRGIFGLLGVLHHFNTHIPFYDCLEPPESNVLELVEPEELAAACEKSIQLIDEEENPLVECPFVDEVEAELLWDEESNEEIPKMNDSLKITLKWIIDLSKDGYYFTFDNE